MSFDDSILANIKTQQDSDDDGGGETFMEVLGGFSENVPESNLYLEEERLDDPLLDGDEEEERKEFPWLCTGNDFLKPYNEEDDDATMLAGSQTKMARVELRGSNGQVWSKVPLTPPIADDLTGYVSSGKGPAKNVTNPLESWQLLFDVPMLNQLVRSTNEVIKKDSKRKEAYQKRLTDMTEMRAWLGLNYLCGVLRNSTFPGPTEELWTLELGNAIFRATMTYKRFKYLTECLRTVEQNEDSPRQPLDEIADMWEKLVINCRSYYAPSDFCMIDEHVLNLSIDPQNPFEHSIPSQDGIKGLRLITMCDAKTLYISNAIVASHQDPLDEEVYQLVSDIKGTRRCLCLNERFSSMNLMQKLKQSQLQVVGAILHTAKEIPPELCDGSFRIPQVWYTQMDTTLIGGLEASVTPTGILLTNGLSHCINAAKLFQTVRDSNIKAYEQIRRFSTTHARTSKHHTWSLEFFYFMLDVSVFNSWILYRLSENGDAGIELRNFQRQLGLYLTQQQLKQRMHMNVKIPLPLKLQIAEILGENVESVLSSASKASDAATKLGTIPAEKALIPEGIVLQSRENDNRRRCRGCKSRNGSKIKTRCQQCLTPFCMRHLISRCELCSGYELQQDLDLNKSEEQLSVELDTSLE